MQLAARVPVSAFLQDIIPEAERVVDQGAPLAPPREVGPHAQPEIEEVAVRLPRRAADLHLPHADPERHGPLPEPPMPDLGWE